VTEPVQVAVPVRPTAGRLDWVDTGRGVAISLVALYHSGNWLASTHLEVGFWRDLSTVLASMRMPLFFVLAGLFATKWLAGPWRSLLRSKVLLFWWVFLVWETVGTLVFPLGLLAGDKPVGMTGLIKALLWAPVMPRFELWFIWALSLFFVLAKLLRSLDARVQLLVAGLASAAALTVWVDSTTGWTGSAKFFFFFLAGIHGRHVLLSFAETVRLATGSAVITVWAAVSIGLFLTDERGAPGLYFVNCLLGVAAGIVISRALSRVRWLRQIGQQTLPIYLAHTPLVLVMTYLISLAGPVDVLGHVPWLVPPVVAALVVSGALLLHRLLRRLGARWVYEPPAWLQRRLFGEFPVR
jgi:uncharacterized membrane protein YcfT